MNTTLPWSAFDQSASWAIATVTDTLFFGTLLAGLTWLITAALPRRLPAAVRATLWLIVLIKFLTPVGPSWSYSLASVCESAVQVMPPALTEARGVRPTAVPTVAPTGSEPVRPPVPSAVVASPVGWAVPLAFAYVAAVMGLGAVRLWRHRTFYVRCQALPDVDDPTLALVAKVCRRLRVRRVPWTKTGDDPRAPFVMGTRRPLLVLPHRYLGRCDELETVIVHELAHLRRGDVLARQLQWIASATFFFWPVVAWVNRRIDRAREYACDEWALRHGKLTASRYARLLLDAALPVQAARHACHPVCMAANPSTVERRIEVVLESTTRSPDRPLWRVVTLVMLSSWSVFALAAGTDSTPPADRGAGEWPATEEGVKGRALEVYNRVAQRETADFDSDGTLSHVEKDTYLTALAMRNAEAFLEEFPYADRNHSERLDILEAYDAIRAVTLIAYADRRPTAGPDSPLDFEFLHEALDSQSWLLDSATGEPTVGELDNIRSVVRRMQIPGSFSARMLDHGGPREPECKGRHLSAERSRFQELEHNIATLEAKLEVEVDPAKTVKLKEMLGKLETLLDKLENT